MVQNEQFGPECSHYLLYLPAASPLAGDKTFLCPFLLQNGGDIAAVLTRLLRTEMVPARSLAWLMEYHLSLIASGSWHLLLNP